MPLDYLTKTNCVYLRITLCELVEDCDCNSYEIAYMGTLCACLCLFVLSEHIQASMSKIQGLLKASPTVFKGLKLMKNTDLGIIILLQKC